MVNDCEKFEECVQTMKNLKNDLDAMKEAHERGLSYKTLDHNDE